MFLCFFSATAKEQVCVVWSLLIFNIAGKLQAGGEIVESFLSYFGSVSRFSITSGFFLCMIKYSSEILQRIWINEF